MRKARLGAFFGFFLLFGLLLRDARAEGLSCLKVPSLQTNLCGNDHESHIEFLGIRYATAERWKHPHLVEELPARYEAVRIGSQCPRGSIPKYEEDCLSLNIWVPKPADPGASLASERRPVAVYLHHGGFHRGSSTGSDVDPARFMAAQQSAEGERVIFVTLNYRLGVLGYLNHPDLDEHSVSGNFGLYDQRCALRWLQRSIADFGGDPARITLIGSSAGAMSVLSHLSARHEQQDRMFHRAVVLSPAHLRFFTPEMSRRNAVDLTRELGCASASAGEQLECMRKRSVTRVMRKGRWRSNRRALFFHTDNAIFGRFFPYDDGQDFVGPQDAFAQGAFRTDVPVILGTTLDEGTAWATASFPVADPPLTRVRELLANAFGGPENAEVILSQYPLDKFEGSTRALLAEVTNDVYFQVPARQAALSLARHGASVRKYLFTHNPSLRTSIQEARPEDLSAMGRKLGVYHTADVPFMLGAGRYPLVYLGYRPLHSEELALQTAMMRSLRAFAAGTDPGSAEWPLFDTERETTLLRDIAGEAAPLADPVESSDGALGGPGTRLVAHYKRGVAEAWTALFPTTHGCPEYAPGVVEWAGEGLRSWTLNVALPFAAVGLVAVVAMCFLRLFCPCLVPPCCSVAVGVPSRRTRRVAGPKSA